MGTAVRPKKTKMKTMTHSTPNPTMILALNQFARRRLYASEIEKIENADLPAGSPMYFYCRHCGIPSEVLPEDYVFPPLQECSQCQGLKSEGWLEEAR
ncbi:MAG: hypothetical protein JNM18_25470 [Planctomycetaceae bacterium]|nr:hypothetical protein [Planctomycetaceae bacterium]